MNLDLMMYSENVGVTLDWLTKEGFRASEATDSFFLIRDKGGDITGIYRKNGELYYKATLCEYAKHLRKRVDTDSVAR